MGPGPQTFWGEVALILVLAWPITLGLLIGALVGIIIGLVATFRKAGFCGGAAVVPIYNLYVLGDIADVSGWYVSAIVIQIFGFLNAIIIKLFDVQIKLDFESILEKTMEVLYNFIKAPEDFVVAYILLISIFVMVYALNYAVSKKFNRGFLFSTGLTLLPFIFWPILGLGSAEYQESEQ